MKYNFGFKNDQRKEQLPIIGKEGTPVSASLAESSGYAILVVRSSTLVHFLVSS